MRNDTNQANVIKRLAFNGFTIISNKRVTGPVRMLLAAAKPDEQCVSALAKRCALNNIKAFLSFDNACRKRKKQLSGCNKGGVYVCCAWHDHLTIKLYVYTVLSLCGADQVKDGTIPMK
ncbi:hypothetical protein [Enterobacter sichuanensis]|uniref:hypothetical protein n=1 Tax=Enterobacter sichuanensis TaxID=2071710 RepID=UPI0020757B72|nr:hypothetical protein [Enterobacter sichuanensis]MCM7883472.1 hypothetical protein [Enterobacter sichuanensis]